MAVKFVTAKHVFHKTQAPVNSCLACFGEKEYLIKNGGTGQQIKK